MKRKLISSGSKMEKDSSYSRALRFGVSVTARPRAGSQAALD